MPRKLVTIPLVFFLAGALLARPGVAAEGVPGQEARIVQVKFQQTNGVIRALHGINKGPLAPGGLLEVIAPQRALGLPSIRLHDCHWPNPDVVDIHAVFPDFSADPSRPESYDFRLTDEYLAAVRETGALIIYRLGESIEHTKIKRFVHPPADPVKWAAICVGIVRHYNEGWAKGPTLGIRYWEIWNEPENRPAMWTGTDEEFLRLYVEAARAIKARFPGVKVGGPAFGNSGGFVKGRFQPTPFVTRFLRRCARDSVPLDFFSWHCYTDDSTELTARAGAIRQLLDAEGFASTESHLNEWNYLPGGSWKALGRGATPEVRRDFYQAMAGAAGAAFVVTALVELQDAPIDGANLFHGELGGFGLFSEEGMPFKNYHALRAFRTLLETPARVESHGAVPGRLAVLAGLDSRRTKGSVLLSNTGSSALRLEVVPEHLPWKGETLVEIRRVDATSDFTLISTRTQVFPGRPVIVELAGPSVILLTLRSSRAAP